MSPITEHTDLCSFVRTDNILGFPMGTIIAEICARVNSMWSRPRYYNQWQASFLSFSPLASRTWRVSSWCPVWADTCGLGDRWGPGRRPPRAWLDHGSAGTQTTAPSPLYNRDNTSLSLYINTHTHTHSCLVQQFCCLFSSTLLVHILGGS